MENLKVRTRTDTGPEGLPAVCISYHPADAGNLDSICTALLRARNCAVCWTEDMTSPVPDAELSRMNLFIFPVSSRFLTEPNRAADADLPFALEHRIPVLPVLAEPGLEDSVPLQEKFDQLQCLRCFPVPPEELTFQEALDLYLEQVLISTRRIRDAAEAGTLDEAAGPYLSGLAHLYGIGTEKDQSRALELIAEAAEAGQPEAMRTLAAMYRNGNGAPVNLTAAANCQAACAYALDDMCGPDSLEAVKTRYRLYEYCRDAGLTSEAETILLGGLRDTDKCTLSDMQIQANRMITGGRYREAVVMAKQVHACIRDWFGSDRRTVLYSLCTIGSYSVSAGEYEMARDLLERVLKEQTALLGEKDPDTLTTLTNLGAAYSYMGEREKAKDMLTRAAAGRSEVLGKEDPVTLSTLSSLAASYQDSGDSRTAEEMLRNVLAVQRRTLGDRNPDTLTTKEYLSALLRARGDSAEAGKLLTEVLEVQEETLGTYHPDTLSTMACIAACCSDAGDHRQARQMLEKVVAAQRKTLGASHPETLYSMHNLAVTCCMCGEKEKALNMLRGVLNVQRRTLGGKHPATLETMHSLGVLSFEAGRHAEGEALLEQTAAARIEVLGSDHPDTVYSLKELESIRGQMRQRQQKKHGSGKKKKR